MSARGNGVKCWDKCKDTEKTQCLMERWRFDETRRRGGNEHEDEERRMTGFKRENYELSRRGI